MEGAKYSLKICFEISEKDTGKVLDTQTQTERFDSRTEAKKAAARYLATISKQGSGIADKLQEISFLSGEWETGEMALLKMGRKLCHREIYKDKETGELFINFDKSRYYQSEFTEAARAETADPAAAIKRPEKKKKRKS